MVSWGAYAPALMRALAEVLLPQQKARDQGMPIAGQWYAG
jgi:hypothetical protein